MPRPSGTRENRCEDIKDGVCLGKLVSGNPFQCQRLFHLKKCRPQGCEAAGGNGATGIPWTWLVLLRSASTGAGAREKPQGHAIALSSGWRGPGMFTLQRGDHQVISLFLCYLHSLGLYACLLWANSSCLPWKLQSMSPCWFICLESPQHSPGTV